MTAKRTISVICQALACAPALILTAPGFAGAQESSNSGSMQKVEEIIVTAQRHEQSLQSVPISLTVLTGEDLVARGATQLEDVQYTIPGLSSFQYGPGQQFIQLRGVSSTLGVPTIGQYLDEMPISGDSSFGSIDVRMLDMERVEVLRGPQPTLYGESSMGGTVRYVTARPRLTELSAAVEAEVGTMEDGAESYKLNAMIDIPLRKDVLGVRLVGGYQEDGGWVDNRTTGVNDQNGLTIKTLRGTLLFRPGPQTELSVMVLHQELDQDAQNFGVNRSSLGAVAQYSVDDYDLVNGVVSHDFASGINFTYSLGYLDRTRELAVDITPFYLGLVTGSLGFPPGFIDEIAIHQFPELKVITHEARLSSQNNDFFNWTVGAYSRDSKSPNNASTITSPGTLPFQLSAAHTRSKSQSWAVFGDVSFQLTESLNLLLGMRYYQDDRELASNNTSLGFSSSEFNSGTFDSVNPRLNLSYEFSPTTMVYFNAAKGFRSGGFNSQAAGGGLVAVPPTYQPDEMWSYEIGTRNQLMDGRLRLEGSVYRNDWRDVQSNNFLLTGSGVAAVTNGGNASGWGVDLSATWIPVEGLSIAATYGWNNMEHDSDTADKNPGDPLDFVVPVSYSASVNYRRPLFGSTHGFVRVDYQHADESQITIRGFLNDQIIPMPGRDLVNVRTGLEFGSVEVSVFLDNALDEDAPIVVGPFGVLLENVEQRPRTVGVTLRTRF